MMLVSVLIISFILGLHHTYLPPSNEVWGKVLFSQVFACPQGRKGLSTGWSLLTGGLHPGGCLQGGLPRGSASSGGLYPGSGGLHQVGVCIRGVGVCIQREESASSWGWADPLGTRKAGGTYPTLMLSFLSHEFETSQCEIGTLFDEKSRVSLS